MEKTYHITTFGCQMNEHDSEVLAGMLGELGFTESKERKNAGIVIINTCSVRENADKRFFGTLGQLKRRKENGEDFLMCVCGCMMQQQHIIDTIKQKYPWVDIIFGTNNLHEFPKLVENAMIQKKKQTEIWADAGEIVEGLPSKRLFKHKAYVNIMYGCNNFCTYCIVPYTRGRERSRKAEDVVNEIKALVADGVVEVMLLGQNVNSYKGVDKDGNQVAFPQLLRMVNEVEGLERIRFMTSHPKDLSDDLISAIAECDKVCKFFHLPVQAGSSDVLRRMNRRYTKEQYLELVKKLRAAVPGIALTTDIIVGFPGETEEDFEHTIDLCKQVQYDSAFTFIYSVRKGTPAEKFEDHIPSDIQHARFNRLVDVVNESSMKKNAEYVGRTERILVEGQSKREKGIGLDKPEAGKVMLSGRTDTFKLVNFIGTKDMIGGFVDVRITASNTFSLVGELI